MDRVIFERAHPGEETPQRRAAAVFPLSGFATCAGCGEVSSADAEASTRTGSGKRTYRCRASLASWRGQRCSAPANVMADRLEAYLLEHIKQAYDRSGAPVLATSVAHNDADANFEDLQYELQAAERASRALRGGPHRRRATRPSGLAAVRTRSDRVQTARLTYREHVDTMRTPDIAIPPVELLDSLTPEELTPVLRAVFQTVRVTKGRGPLPPRVHLTFHGEPQARVTTLKNTA